MFAAVFLMVSFNGLSDETTFGAWHLSYAQALKDVESHDKPLFVVFDTLDSELGEAVASDSFMGEQVERLLADDYVRMFVDVGSETGRRLAAEFGAAEFPRVVIIDRSTNWQVYRRSGKHSTAELVKVLNQNRRIKVSSSSSMGSVSLQSSYYGPTGSTTTSAAMCRT